MTKYTAGPWTAHIDHSRDADEMHVFAPDRGTIAMTGQSGMIEPAEMIANTRLIAAAPDLMAALITYHNAIMAGRDPDRTAIAKAYLAINKARGE